MRALVQKHSWTLYLVLLMHIVHSCNDDKGKAGDVSAKKNTDMATKYGLANIKLPSGFRITVYAEVPNARSMALSPNGVLYVGNRSGENVYAVVDENKDGTGDKVYTVATGLNSPNGVAMKD